MYFTETQTEGLLPMPFTLGVRRNLRFCNPGSRRCQGTAMGDWHTARACTCGLTPQSFIHYNPWSLEESRRRLGAMTSTFGVPKRAWLPGSHWCFGAWCTSNVRQCMHGEARSKLQQVSISHTSQVSPGWLGAAQTAQTDGQSTQQNGGLLRL